MCSAPTLREQRRDRNTDRYSGAVMPSPWQKLYLTLYIEASFFSPLEALGIAACVDLGYGGTSSKGSLFLLPSWKCNSPRNSRIPDEGTAPADVLRILQFFSHCP